MKSGATTQSPAGSPFRQQFAPSATSTPIRPTALLRGLGILRTPRPVLQPASQLATKAARAPAPAPTPAPAPQPPPVAGKFVQGQSMATCQVPATSMIYTQPAQVMKLHFLTFLY